MAWRETEIGWFDDADGTTSAELLVAVLPDKGTPAAIVRKAATIWAHSLPTASFVIFDHSLTRAVVETLLHQALAYTNLPPSRLLLVGLTDGATVGFSIVIGASHRACAGMVAYDAKPFPLVDLSTVARHTKLRLIGCMGQEADEEQFAQTIRDLGRLGADIRGTLLLEPGLTPSAIRLGAAYLGELSASALDLPRAPAAFTTRHSSR